MTLIIGGKRVVLAGEEGSKKLGLPAEVSDRPAAVFCSSARPGCSSGHDVGASGQSLGERWGTQCNAGDDRLLPTDDARPVW